MPNLGASSACFHNPFGNVMRVRQYGTPNVAF
jgi:hypothetical protein